MADYHWRGNTLAMRELRARLNAQWARDQWAQAMERRHGHPVRTRGRRRDTRTSRRP